ncbi:NUDIX domain-containing protein [Runella sp.]|jgi:ADP-ribose pyrophosphatase YjhB (NUDIX family)|uniref:NUDIX hydrolase n=1 Tax=Runella sp. TaxID=1960881 RepID=UPI0026018C45|nr:NUDIX domain-containing protein [Runella sp.]
MPTSQPIKAFLDKGPEYLPSVSVDCVIFGFHENQLKVLLLEFKHTKAFALPGGFVFKEESTDEAATRILWERTGVKDIYLEQFHTFGEQNRGNWDVHKATMSSHGFELEVEHWLLQRFISIGYYALVDFSKVQPTPDIFSDLGDWYDIHQIPALILDHNMIIDKALETLRLMLDHKLVGFNLLSETFTMNELQSLYETILDKKLLRANFQRKMLSLGILERVKKKFSGKAHKPPYVYRINQNQ